MLLYLRELYEWLHCNGITLSIYFDVFVVCATCNLFRCNSSLSVVLEECFIMR